MRPTARDMCSSLLEIMDEGSDMSPNEAVLMKKRVALSEKSFAADSAASAKAQFLRTSSGQQMLGPKNPRILIANPFVVDKMASAVTCMLRIDQAILVGCANGDLVMMVEWGEEASVRVSGAHSSKVNALVWNDASETVFSGGDDGALHAWHWSSKKKKLKRLYSAKGHSGVVTALAPIEGPLLVACYETGDVVVWSVTKDGAAEVATGQVRSPAYVCCVRVSLTECVIMVGTLAKIYFFVFERGVR